MRLGDAEFHRQEVVNTHKKVKIEHANLCGKCWYMFREQQQVHEPMETQILEKTIIKLGGLLALCFGQEGGDVIASYLGEDDGSVDMLRKGDKLNCITGVCQIRNLIPLTEVLQERVFMFVNEINQLVHLSVDEHSGAPNKSL